MTATPRRRGRPAEQEAKLRRKEEILSCAARVFARHGYQDTDMQALADEAGVAKGTLYLYFPSKEKLFLATVDQGMQNLMAYIDGQTGERTDSTDFIGVAIKAYLTFFKEHPEQVELLILERAVFRDRKRPTYFELRDSRRDHWHDILRRLISAGQLREVPVSRIDDVLSDLVYGTMFTNHFSGRHKPLDVQVADILDIAFRGILSEQQRRDRRTP